MPKELLNEAYRILSNPEKRALYDRLITRYPHPEALDKLNTGKQKQAIKSLDLSAYTGAESQHSKDSKKSINNSYYQPVITQYCTFCKTPHEQSPCRDTAPLCGECKRPLFPPSKSFVDQQRRDIVRLTNNSKVQIYIYWPGKINVGTITDISPLGLQLISSTELTKDQTIKIDGEDFKAVGIVSYTNKNEQEGSKESHTIGIQF
ncbi:MAG: curved DNA-binding protein CbpA [Gammaproteobacteria bacterium]|jgi:curved DNA-binding protein CbpA